MVVVRGRGTLVTPAYHTVGSRNLPLLFGSCGITRILGRVLKGRVGTFLETGSSIVIGPCGM